MEVRLARQEDTEAIRAIYNAEVIGSTVTFDLEPRSAEDQRSWIARHQGAHPAVVAVEGSTVVGFGSLSPFRDRAAYATTVENSLYVDGAWRGRGVGRLLLDELVALARARGFHTVIARVSGDNEPSMALHRACGFVLVGVEREVGRKFGRWNDVAVLQLML
jgi:L-amino acid N-acyltransferase YncA